MTSQTALQTRLMAKLPLIWRRRALRGLWLTGRRRDFGLAGRIGDVLRLGRRDAGRIDGDIAFHDALTGLEWASMLARSVPQLAADASHIALHDGGLLARIAASGKPVILAPLHMGNYALCLASLMKTIFAGRPLLILRARDDDADDTQVMRRIGEIGAEMRFLKASDKADYFEAVRFVRKGAVVIYLVDLPPSYGSPVEITLFGCPMKIALGIDALARLTEATVVPLATTASLTGDAIHLGQPFEVTAGGGAERRRVAGLIAAHIEQAVLRAPEQWHFWPRLDEFMDDAGVADAAPTEAAA